MGRYLGQHFLKNKAAINKIIAALDLQNGELIVEIGPGKGALTIPLVEAASKKDCKVLAIEKDEELGSRVKGLGYSENLEVIIGDALKELPKLPSRYSLNTMPFKAVGNIPYYITGKLLRILSEMEVKPKITVLMIQREVAERITAKPGEMNLLAAATQFWASGEIIMRLKPGDFDPPPEVDSAIIKLGLRVEGLGDRVNAEDYYKTIKILFKQPRKTILNNLEAGTGKNKAESLKILESLGFNEKSRPQELSVKNILAIVDKIA